ncbi:MAG: 30S ribosomal protein S12 methylthiotransferase RimO [Nitrospirae bacterium]|nr:30S ribosomal protein S12 methylthiotransferase RimO [Nitrospirota bacterium]
MGKVHLLSLGCPKNLVDSENLLKRLREKGIYYSSDPADSDVIMVNTCGFIEAAKKESIEEILRVSDYKKQGKKLIVFGCLAERFGKDMKKEIPEIDEIWGVGRDEEIIEYCSRVRAGSATPPREERLHDMPYAYLKIAEGCDRGCTYCAIPGIRGAYKGREPGEVLREAEELVGSGTKELILVAQDITSYGKGLKGYDLSRLIKDIASIGGDFWIRLLYLYPASVDERLLETVSDEQKVCRYIDMPLQHSEEKILRLMGRGGSRRYFEQLIKKIRQIIPEVTIRTTFIVGFPQETEKDFEGLADFVQRMEFDRLGVFTYSKEAETEACRLKGHIPRSIRQARYNRLMEIQSSISLEKNKALVGKTLRALIDEVGDDITIARLSSQAPEIDGVVMLRERDLKKGDFVNIGITEAYDYDLMGTIRR